MAVELVALEQLSDPQLLALFKDRGHEPELLAALNEELKKRHTDEALELQMAVSAARVRLSKKAAATSTSVQQDPIADAKRRAVTNGPVRSWLAKFFGARGLASTDGRPLFRYRMTDCEFDEAKVILRRLARDGRLEQPDDRSGALFVAYCAEWFRRESTTTFLRWNDPAPDLFPTIPDNSKRELARRGLERWHRPLRVVSGNREFLLTVALEGGIPLKVLADGAKGWLRDYLRAVMHRSIVLGVSTSDDVLLVADEEGWRIRKSYRHEDFIHICSELAERLLHWRAVAEREGTGSRGLNAVRNSQLLDFKHPSWRDELPVYVGKEDESVVEGLLAGLVDEKLTGLPTEGVGTQRYLLWRGGRWMPALQLLADGEIPSAKVPELVASLGRARAVPAGELSNYIAGDFALLEPPVGVQRRWRIRPFSRVTRLIADFPLEASVAVTLTSSGSPRTWTWPGGESLRSELLVFRQDDGAAEGERLLRFLRKGSVASSAKTLYALCPEQWSVEAKDDRTALSDEPLPALGRKLVTIEGTAYFRSTDPDAPRFRVETNAEEREDELELETVHNLVLANERCELVPAQSAPMVCGKCNKRRPLRSDELFVRMQGGRWTPHTGPLTGAGLVELSWRDPAAGIQLEKRLVALVPAGASVRGKLIDAQSGEVELTGLPGWTAVVPEPRCETTPAQLGGLSIRFSGRPFYRLPIRLIPPQGEGFDILVSLVGRDGVTVLADGTVLRPASTLDLRALRGAMAISPRRATLQLTLKGERSGGIRTIVDGELPLSVLRSGIQEMLGAAAHQDDVIELEFLGDTRPPIRISRYGLQALTCEAGKIRWSSPPNRSGMRLVARMVLDPRHEHELEQEADGVWWLSKLCFGVCLVYLRDGPDVVSRPLMVVGRAAVPTGESLMKALEDPQHETRQTAILAALTEIGRGQNNAKDLQWLLDAATNLNGLPPSALDGLARLPKRPTALVRLLLVARDDAEHHLIWALQNELPFLWLSLPVSAWQEAISADMQGLMVALEAHLGREQAAALAMDRLRSLAARITANEPALAAVLHQAGCPTDQKVDLPNLINLTSRHVANRSDSADENRNAIARLLASQGLNVPPAILSMAHEEHAGLFAPLLLAASARGRLNLNRELMLVCRRILREDPQYISGSYPHFLEFYR